MHRESILEGYEDLKKETGLLKASVRKYRKKPYEVGKIYTPNELESYDALSFRFMKNVDLILSFFRSIEKYLDAKESETLRDRLLFIQKLNIVHDIDFWFEARELRGKFAHTYLPSKLKDIYTEIIVKSNVVFDCERKLGKYLKKIAQKHEPMLFDNFKVQR